jgi:hypothetical protein
VCLRVGAVVQGAVMHRSRRLALLVVVHLAGGALLGGYGILRGGRLPGLAWEHLPVAALLALTFGQACLLGFWAAFSAASGWLRLGGLVAGAVYLEVLTAAGSNDDDFLFMASIAAGVIATVLLTTRLRWAELRRVEAAGPRPDAEGLRFSIRGLMLFTLGVALLMGGARGTRQAFGHLGPGLFVTAVWSLSLVVLALAACWATLGPGRPWARVAAVSLGAVASGALFAYGIGEDRSWESLGYFVIITAGQSALVLASLLVVRSAGLRLLARSAPRERPPADVVEAAS